MFEQFTEKSIRIVSLAREEARHLGHHRVDTEHLLLGILAEGTGVAAAALTRLGATLAAVRSEVARRCGSGSAPVIGELPLAPGAERVLRRADEEARVRRDRYTGTGHLLLGLLAEPEAGQGLQTLQELGIAPEAVAAQVGGVVGGTALVASIVDAAELHPEVHQPLARARPVDPGLIASETAARLVALLFQWVEPRRLGWVTTGTQPLLLPTGDALCFDLAFYALGTADRLPALAAAVVTPERSANALGLKLQFALTLGVRVGLLVDPYRRQLDLYGVAPGLRTLAGAEVLTLPALLPGWQLPLAQLWPP